MAGKGRYVIIGVAEIGSERRELQGEDAFTHAYSSRQALKQVAKKLGEKYPHCRIYLGECEAILLPDKEEGGQ